MNAAHVVLLIGVFIAVAAIAGYLIAITLILKHVVNRLVTILGAVQATTDTAQPVGPVIDDINKDLVSSTAVAAADEAKQRIIAQPFRTQAVLDELSETQVLDAPIMGRLETINRCFASDRLEDILAALDAEPDDDWCADQARLIRG